MAGRIPQSFINDLLARVDIVDVIDQRVPLKKAGKDYQARCPFHDEKTPSFSVSPDKQFYYCFGCQASGTALTFLLEHDRMDFIDAVESLAASVGMEVPRERGAGPDRRAENEPLYQALTAAETYFRARLKDDAPAIAYLKGRGITGMTARDFGIGYAPEGWQNITSALPAFSEAQLLEVGLLTRNDKGRVYDRFRERIMFPIRDLRGRVVGFGGRVMGGDAGPKYLNSPETPVFHKSEELYGLFEARTRNRQLRRVVVVEGYMDVVALAQAGVPYAVATLGTSVGRPHFRKIFRYTDEAVCCFDGDQAGRQAAWRALEAALAEISEGKQLKFAFLPEGEDPDSLVRDGGAGAFTSHLDNAVPAVDYLFDKLSDGLSLDSVADKAKLAGLAAPYMELVQAGLLRDFMQARLAAMTDGLSAAATPRETLRPVRADAIPSSGALSRISDRLLTHLLKQPRLVDRLSSDKQQQLDDLPVGGLLTQVIAYLAAHAEAGIEELLAHWADEADYTTLLRLAERPRDMPEASAAQEFLDGVDQYIRQVQRGAERELLRAVKEDPSRENLLRYLSRKQAASEGAAD